MNSLTKEEKERYKRQIVLKNIGKEGQERLKKTRVAIVGVGGLGSISAMYLASMGVGFLRIVDHDVVEVSNLHRQIVYTTYELDYPKVEVAKNRLEAMNPYCKVEPLSISVNPNTVKEIVEGIDLVIDGLDRFSSRFTINKACVQRNIPYVFGGAIETLGNASTFIPYDDDSPCLECIFSKVRDEELETCETVGVHSSIVGIISCIQISEAVRILTGKKPLLKGKLLFCNLENLDFQTIEIVKNPTCPTCSKKRPEKVEKPSEAFVTEVCGRDAYQIVPAERPEWTLSQAINTISKYYNIKIRSKVGCTFNYNDKVIVSLFSGGNTLIRGAKSKEDALEIYKQILNKISEKST